MTLDGLAQEGARQLLMTASRRKSRTISNASRRDEKGHALVRNGRAQARKPVEPWSWKPRE